MKTCLICIFLFCAQTFVSAQSHINLKITNLKNTQGALLISVFKSSDGFPGDDKKAVFKHKIDPISANSISYKITGLTPGEYAISILHDENRDQKLNTNSLGIPSEGTAASNNAKMIFGPPKFDEAKFTLSNSPINMEIKLKHF